MLRDGVLKNARGQWMQHHELYPLLGLRRGEHLPEEGMWPQVVAGVVMYIRPKAEVGPGCRARVMVKCPCGRDVPFGRMGQHVRRRGHP